MKKSKKIDSKQFRKPKRKQNPEILENHPKNRIQKIQPKHLENQKRNRIQKNWKNQNPENS